MATMKLQFNNRTILTPSRDSFVAFNYVPAIPEYTRYMWRFDTNNYQFQLSGLKINSISLPYTYITSYFGGSTWGDGNVQNFIDSDETNKWGGNLYNNHYGWIIFDLPSATVPETYSLKTANDTATEDRRPNRSRLYASTGTPTTFDDVSWVLLDDRDPQLPLANLTWCGPYTLNQI